MNTKNLPSLLLRIGIALVFFYAAIGSFLQPLNWIGYFPLFLQNFIPQKILLIGFSLYELSLGIWIMSGKKTFAAALLAALTIMGIIITNYTLLDVLFRDIAIFFSALALAVLSKSKK